MHLLNLALAAGTREVSRGREGGARFARPDAREQGKSAEVGRSVCKSAGVSETTPHHSRSGGWGGEAHPGGGSRSGQTACVFALRVRLVWWSSTLIQRAGSSLCGATVDYAAPGKWSRMLVPLRPHVSLSIPPSLSLSLSLSFSPSLSRALSLSLSLHLSRARSLYLYLYLALLLRTWRQTMPIMRLVPFRIL